MGATIDGLLGTRKQIESADRRQDHAWPCQAEGGVGPDDLKHKNLITLYIEAFI